MEGGNERDEGRRGRGREGRLRGEINARKKSVLLLCCVDICCHRHISCCINRHPPSDEHCILS